MEPKEIVKIYKKFYKEHSKPPTLEDFKDLGVTRQVIREKFKNLTNLHKAVREEHPNLFHDISVEEALGNADTLDLKDYERYVITTAVTGCFVDEKFLNSLKHYCKVRKARLIVLTCSDPAHRTADWSKLGHIDKRITEYVVPNEVYLNDNLFLCNIKTTAKQINPLTGLKRIAGKTKSFIMASPKMKLETIAASKDSYPKVAMTTMAVTKPDYSSEMYMSQRTAYLGEKDHKMGAVVVEIESDKKFHFRHVEAAGDGSFIDECIKYTSNTKKPVRAEAVVFGDWHSGSTCPDTYKMGQEICKLAKPEYLFVHDSFDGLSINHHQDHNIVAKARAAESGLNSLSKELDKYVDDLVELSKLADKLAIVYSNHDDFLHRYLQSGKFIKDSVNLKTALDLCYAYVNGKDPLQYAVEQRKKIDNIEWLNEDKDKVLSGRHFNHHGHRGPNGAKGSMKSLGQHLGAVVSGHTHSMARDGDAVQVGTFTLKDLGYNVGLSSWTNTLGIQYYGGAMQLITLIDGTYRLKD